MPARAATTVSLTFDDGQATQLATKAPLAARGMHATYYVNSARVGTSGFYMTWPQVTSLAADGNEIGGHTLSHVNLTSLSESQQRAEVCNDKQNLVARGFDPVSFAYPFGASDEAAQAIVAECGYLSARRVGGIVSPNWCPQCGTPRAESVPPENAFDLRTPSFGSGEITLPAIQGVITQAELSGGGWVPLLFHGVCESGCGEGWIRPSTFSALLDWLAPRTAHGTVVRTVRQVMQHGPPETTIGSKPPAVTAERSASFAFTSTPAGATFDCSLDNGAFAPCTSPVAFSGLSLGQHTFRVRARDGFGAVDPTPASWTWTVDAPPDPTTVSLTFDDAQATQYAVRDDLADHGMHGTFFVNSESVCTTDCAGEFNMTWAQLAGLAADGNEIGGHTLDHVDLTSSALSTAEKRRQVCEDRQNLAARGFEPVSFAYPFAREDATARAIVAECGYGSARSAGDAPAGGETIPPLDPFATRTPGHSEDEITLAEMQGVITQAEAIGGGWVQLGLHGICETRCNDGWVKPSTFAALLDWLEPRAATKGTVVRTVREVIEGDAPNTAIGSKPPVLSNLRTASFTLSSNRGGVTFQCSLDGAPFSACNNPASYSGLVDGDHTFRVRARDASGVVDATPASWTWRVDATAPDTSLTGGPTATVAATGASFTFTATEAGSFQCKLDGGAWEACTSPRSYSALAQGAHTFSVRAIDAAGNADGSPASRTWAVDAVAPETSIESGPSGTVASTAASFAIGSNEAATFECSIDGAAYAACSSPKTYSGLGQGPHTFSVRAIDAVGNADLTPASRTWAVDTFAPDTSISSGPSGTSASSGGSFGFTGTESGSFECSLDGAVYAACGSPKSYAGLTDGAHTFSVRAIDAVGNADPTPASRTWTIDTMAPETSITGGPTGTVATKSASFGFTAPGATSFECKLDGGDWSACLPPAAHADLSEGAHTFSVRAIDAVGNVDSTPASRSWTVDTVPPETLIAGGATGTVPSKAASFDFSAAGAAAFECKLDRGDWAACSSPKSYSGLAEGDHSFSVRGIDAVGNVDATPAAGTWTVDTLAPDTSITGGPMGTVSSKSASFVFSAAGATSFECRLDSGDWAACSSPKAHADLAEGDHTFRVRGIDGVGNVDATPDTRAWTVDTVAPETSVTGGPTGTVPSKSASFEFSAAGAVSFECRLDGGDWAVCSSPNSYDDVADGGHTFLVRGIDAVGNADSTPAARIWTVDTEAPETSITVGATGTVASRDASFEFSAPDAVSFECRLDGGDWATCSSPKAHADLSEGAHTFAVRGVDAVGNLEAAPASRTWTVDTVAPQAAITDGPTGAVPEKAASFDFAAAEAASFECRLDGGDWDACSPPKSYADLPDGAHTFSVRAADAIGNVGSAASRDWTVETPLPPPVDPPKEQPPTGDPPPQDPPVQEPPVEEPPREEPPAEEPPAEEPALDAQRYLDQLLRDAARANRGRKLRALVRGRALELSVPAADDGALRITLALLPYPSGRAIRLASGEAEASVSSRQLSLKLGRRARRTLRPLHVAALQLSARFEPSEGATVHARRVFKVRR